VTPTIFRLNPECHFLKGERRGAIFDLIEGDVYSLNEDETKIVSSFEKNSPVDINEPLLKELRRLCLGTFYDQPIYVQKLRIGSQLYDQQMYHPPAIYRAFIEINNACERDCWFCGYYGIKRSSGCLGCNKWAETGTAMESGDWYRVIEERRDLGCRSLYITGGDLTQAWDKAMACLDFSSGMFSKVYLITHSQSLSEGLRQDINDRATIISQKEDVAEVQPGGDIRLLISQMCEGDNQTSAGYKNMIIDHVLKNSELLGNVPSISYKTMSSESGFYLNNMNYHPCLGHTVSICFNGKIIPCPMMRNHALGDAHRCDCCEYKYACTDCRALEEALTGCVRGKVPCSYDLSKGTGCNPS
jgi:hypothetical protein